MLRPAAGGGAGGGEQWLTGAGQGTGAGAKTTEQENSLLPVVTAQRDRLKNQVRCAAWGQGICQFRR